jgi:hypothetical protein
MLGNRPRQGVAVVSTPILTRYYFEVIDDYLLEVRRSSIATLAYYVRSTRHIYSPNTCYLGIYLGNILSQQRCRVALRPFCARFNRVVVTCCNVTNIFRRGRVASRLTWGLVTPQKRHHFTSTFRRCSSTPLLASSPRRDARSRRRILDAFLGFSCRCRLYTRNHYLIVRDLRSLSRGA